eukprot:TRINITY_DN37133_c0_g1_i1.p1 TRINITY_DN37133_c0_g1~~TRINITY_DN37133_c0_g1_i1.p1  ORF type:complete len:236 (-),score=56.92 TRINITY_DN37133_c0_g1_i1:12-623(-)
MTTQNRPYNVQMVVDNLHGRVKKTVAQRTIDSMVESGKLVLKEFGKQKVYLVNQATLSKPSQEELSQLDTHITQLEEQLRSYQDEARTLDGEQRALTSQLTNEEIAARLTELKGENAKLAERLNVAKQGASSITPEEKKSIEQSFVRNLKEWKKRKRMCGDILDKMAEGTDKAPSSLREELGLEVDEDCNAVMPPMPAEKRAR